MNQGFVAERVDGLMGSEELARRVHSLRALPKETEWVEFKENNANPQVIGEYLSALANSAALCHKEKAYILWGVRDGSHDLVGTRFDPRTAKVGNEELENWLLTQLTPRIDVRIDEGPVDALPVVLFSIQPAVHTPVAFKGIRYIRIGSYKKKLKDHPEKERALWSLLSGESFESSVATSRVTAGDVLELIDYPSYFRLMKVPLPENRAAILERLEAENVVIRQGADRFDISNVGAILFAADLARFNRLARKAPRVIFYRGRDRLETIKEQTGGKGYAIGFNGLVDYINDRLPQHEEIGTAFRREVRMFPKVAVRELVANALIHQDLMVSGTSPMIEIFSDRLEISNPGPPLIDTLRFMDEPPQSRNEILAKMMRRMDICEERGTGIDKVISSVEKHQLPAPDFRATPHATIAVLFGPKDLSDMVRSDRVRACYQHTCLLHISGRQMTNSSLRERLGIEKKSHTVASRIIRDTIDEGLVKLIGGPRRDARYVPFWA